MEKASIEQRNISGKIANHGLFQKNNQGNLENIPLNPFSFLTVYFLYPYYNRIWQPLN